MKNKHINEALKQRSLKDCKELLKKWDTLAANMKEVPTGVPIILPDIFLVSKSGAGRTYFVNLLAEYLGDKSCLLDFYGDVKYFEFMLNYCAPSEHFSEIQRLMSEVDNAGGFRSEYRGIVFIDIDEWYDHFEEKHFLSFMEYLSDNSEDWLVVLSLSGKNEEKTACAESVISSFLRIERINIETPTATELVEFVETRLSAYGLSLKLGAKSVIFESLKLICRSKYFDGYKTAKMLVQDIAYHAYSNGVKGRAALSESDVEAFKKDGEYIQRMILKIKKTGKIGF